MTSKAATDAKRVYEQERAAAYRDFFQELEGVGKLPLAQAISHKPAVAEIGKPPSESSAPSLPPFERVLFNLYERIVTAYKRSLVDAGLQTSTVVRRLARHVESTYQEIYLARTEEFAQQAGFYANKAFPEFYLRLLRANASGHRSKVFRRLEDEVLARETTRRESAKSPFRRPLKAIREDERRRVEAKKDYSGPRNSDQTIS